MKILTIVGARPQFIKAAPVCQELKARGYSEYLVHTGQHYDYEMSQAFFEELNIKPPDINLGVGSGSHAKQTGEMLIGIEEAIKRQHPDWVLVYGDTNSTQAGALAAAKIPVPIAHIEAGLRSFNRSMPEEINRIVVDHISDLLLCPSEIAVRNLAAEGITRGVHMVGDVMHDALRWAVACAQKKSNILEELGLQTGAYLLATIHRAGNTDNPERLRRILTALGQLAQREPVVFPVHPRTRNMIDSLGFESKFPGVRFLPPCSYINMVRLEQSARVILTDSGGIQKEAYWLSVPCVTLREETEWVETVETGWNQVVGTDTGRIIKAALHLPQPEAHPLLYGDGQAASRCVEALANGRSFV
jgi:UDP-N-acetylglucosamine 2-epimerase